MASPLLIQVLKTSFQHKPHLECSFCDQNIRSNNQFYLGGFVDGYRGIAVCNPCIAISNQRIDDYSEWTDIGVPRAQFIRAIQKSLTRCKLNNTEDARMSWFWDYAKRRGHSFRRSSIKTMIKHRTAMRKARAQEISDFSLATLKI
jgi:hypothetical protein